MLPAVSWESWHRAWLPSAWHAEPQTIARKGCRFDIEEAVLLGFFPPLFPLPIVYMMMSWVRSSVRSLTEHHCSCCSSGASRGPPSPACCQGGCCRFAASSSSFFFFCYYYLQFSNRRKFCLWALVHNEPLCCPLPPSPLLFPSAPSSVPLGWGQ